MGVGGAGRGVLMEFHPANVNACTSWSKMLLVLARFVLDGSVAQMSEPEWLGWLSVCSSLVCLSSTHGRKSNGLAGEGKGVSLCRKVEWVLPIGKSIGGPEAWSGDGHGTPESSGPMLTYCPSSLRAMWQW